MTMTNKNKHHMLQSKKMAIKNTPEQVLHKNRSVPAPTKLDYLISLINALPKKPLTSTELFDLFKRSFQNKAASFDYLNRKESVGVILSQAVKYGEEGRKLIMLAYEMSQELPRRAPLQEVETIFWEKGFTAYIQNLDDKIKGFVSSSPKNDQLPDSFGEARIRYDEIVNAGKSLSKIGELNSQLYERRRNPIFKESVKHWHSEGYQTLLETKLTAIDLIIDQNGKFHKCQSLLLDALEGVEVIRIRKCPICGSIFWAGRLDQKSCSKKCNQTLRIRRWRETQMQIEVTE